MKHMIYCVLVVAGIYSGNLFSQTVANDVKAVSSGGKLTLVRIQNGTSLVNTSADGIKLYAEFSKGKVVKWTATDKNGGYLTTTASTKDEGSKTTCEVCLSDSKTPYSKFCYQVDCKDIPKPPSKRVAKPVNRTATRY